MKIKELMHNGAEVSAPTTSVQNLAKAMKDKDIGAVAIVENNHLIGMVTDRDIVLALAEGRDLSTLTAHDVMSRDVATCHDTDHVHDALHTMETRRIRRLPVLDHSKKMVGMVSLGDISHKAPHDLASKMVKAVSASHA